MKYINCKGKFYFYLKLFNVKSIEDILTNEIQNGVKINTNY